MQIVILIIIILIGAYFLRHWSRGSRGLDQWPNPHGRYYDEWLKLEAEKGGDYYGWLAKKMGDREPWKSWALKESALNRS